MDAEQAGSEDDVESNEEQEKKSQNKEDIPRWQRVCSVVALEIGLGLHSYNAAHRALIFPSENSFHRP